MIDFSRKTKKIKKPRFVLFLFVWLMFLMFRVFLNGDYGRNEYRQTHTFIHNVYYYPVSKSLGDNALAFVMAMDKRTTPDITKYQINVIGTDQNGQELGSKMSLSVEAVENARCDYQMTLGQSNTIENLQILEIESGDQRVRVPFKHARTKSPSAVIFCISPQFVAEQWQAFLAQVHISHRFGAHLHVYIVSIIESYFNLMKEYEKHGYLTIDQWLTIKFDKTSDKYLEPNRNVELRNQAAAQTDCLLQYKEVAHYIAFLDMDDIIVPSSAKSYYEEFLREFQGNPFISNIYYVKYDFDVEKMARLKDQTISGIVKSARLLSSKDLGKSVVRPQYYISTWIHYSMNSNTKENQRWTRGVRNGVFHFKKMIMTESNHNNDRPIPHALVRDAVLISETNLMEIDKDLENLQKDPHFKQIADTLPTEEFYMPIVFECYNRSFYYQREIGQLDTTKLCINAYDCELPQRSDIKCVHSDAIYQSGPPMFPITFHSARFPTFSRNIGCYQ